MIVVDRLREHKVVIARQDVTVITYGVVFARLSVIGTARTVLSPVLHVIFATFFLVFASLCVSAVTCSHDKNAMRFWVMHPHVIEITFPHVAGVVFYFLISMNVDGNMAR